jgi:hypothetical protein
VHNLAFTLYSGEEGAVDTTSKYSAEASFTTVENRPDPLRWEAARMLFRPRCLQVSQPARMPSGSHYWLDRYRIFFESPGLAGMLV